MEKATMHESTKERQEQIAKHNAAMIAEEIVLWCESRIPADIIIREYHRQPNSTERKDWISVITGYDSANLNKSHNYASNEPEEPSDIEELRLWSEENEHSRKKHTKFFKENKKDIEKECEMAILAVGEQKFNEITTKPGEEEIRKTAKEITQRIWDSLENNIEEGSLKYSSRGEFYRILYSHVIAGRSYEAAYWLMQTIRSDVIARI